MDENDFSKAIEQVQKMLSENEGQNNLGDILGNLLSGMNGSDMGEKAEECSAGGKKPMEGMGDMEMFLKMQRLMSAMNSIPENNELSFLNALKPFLKPKRRQSVDQAVKLINVSRAFKIFKEVEDGGDRGVSPLQ